MRASWRSLPPGEQVEQFDLPFHSPVSLWTRKAEDRSIKPWPVAVSLGEPRAWPWRPLRPSIEVLIGSGHEAASSNRQPRSFRVVQFCTKHSDDGDRCRSSIPHSPVIRCIRRCKAGIMSHWMCVIAHLLCRQCCPATGKSSS